MKPTYVIGHLNPDTDSICSAISYAYLKNEIGEKAVAARAGVVNAETQFVLDYFDVKPPKLVHDFLPKAKDVMIEPPPALHVDDTLWQAGSILRSAKIKSVPIVDENNKFLGIVSVGDLAKRYFDEMSSFDFRGTDTRYSAVLEVLSGELLAGKEQLENIVDGLMKIAGSSIETIKKTISKGDIVLVGDRYDIFDSLLDIEVGAIIVTSDCTIAEDILVRANDKKIVVMGCKYDTFSCARLISQSIPVKVLMQKEVISFTPETLVEDIKVEVLKSHYRNYPVLEKGRLLGFINRNGLIMPEVQNVILVDHNEINQAVEGIENTRIVEIIDHHRLGGMQTSDPIYLCGEPVGCTATIVRGLFRKYDVAVPRHIAGLLLSAILSDTLLFKSPTTTNVDRDVAKELAVIVNVDIEEYGIKLLRAGASIKKRTPSDVVKQDLKEFQIGKHLFSIGQVFVFDSEEIIELKDILLKKLEILREKEKYDVSLIMATNIITESTDLLVAGDAKDIIEHAFKTEAKNNVYSLPGVLSRKKQVVPPLVSAVRELE